MTALYLALLATQPLLQAFDELLLLKRGGETIFNGRLGKDSSDLVEYFQVRCMATVQRLYHISPCCRRFADWRCSLASSDR